MKLLDWLWTLFFGCFHRRTTWPHRHRVGFDYVCCLDCGKELPYSLELMRIATREELLQQRSQQVWQHSGYLKEPSARVPAA